MADAGLFWNESKSKILHTKRGKFSPEQGDITLTDGFVLKYLQHEETYKFLGVPECEIHDVPNLTKQMKKMISQRANVVWSSMLSDYNKIIARNIFFVNSRCLYVCTKLDVQTYILINFLL